MSDSKENGSKTEPVEKAAASLNLGMDSGRVKQNFSHGRSKNVVVEKKRKRVLKKPGAKLPLRSGTLGATQKGQPDKKSENTQKQSVSKAYKAKPPTRGGKAGGAGGKASGKKQNSGLSSDEMNARVQALILAKKRAVEEEKQRKIDEENARKRELELEKQRQEEAKLEAERKKAEEAERLKREAEEKSKKEKEKQVSRKQNIADVQSKVEKVAPASKEGRPAAAPRKKDAVPPKPSMAPKKRETAAKTPAKRRQDDGYLKNRLTINNFDDIGKQKSLAATRRRLQRQKRKQAGIEMPQVKVSREVVIPDEITIQELSNRMTERAVDIVGFLMKQGEMLQPSDVIDTSLAELVVEEFGHKVKRVSAADVEIDFIGAEDDESDLEPRAPVVTIMGHVDHGKTSLLDAIRNTRVTEGEAGGITQHIGAYQVRTSSGELISFIDTPGHAAFTEMRARGAQVTDIVVLVVAADDGVMPQTVEAIHHAKAAEVPIIVAINKIDKPEADPNRVRTELLQHEIVVETMGGDVQDVEVSAMTGQNLDGLLEGIALQAEVLELKANPNRAANGFVIEAQLERGRGTVATLLVERGTLNIGNIVVAGTSWGKVRALLNDHGKNVKDAGPAVPVEVLGLNEPPAAGDQFSVVEHEAKAREITAYRQRLEKDIKSASVNTATSLEQMMSQLKAGEQKAFSLIIKGDVHGSVEAIVNALAKLGTDEVQAKIVHSGAGAINESDVTLARATGAAIMGFNVRANNAAKESASSEGVEIRYYSVIYDLVDDVKAAMSGMLDPTLREHFLGNAEILEVFNISKVGKVAGCRVTEGKVERGAKVRLIRDSVVIHEGELSTLKRFKDEVKEVVNGQECGMAFTNYEDMRTGDIIECFHIEEVARTLD